MSITICDSCNKKNKKKQNNTNLENDNKGIIHNNSGSGIININEKGNLKDIEKKNNEDNNIIQNIIVNQAKEINGTIGLINLGFTCYFNSAIQNLKNVYPLTLYILKNYKTFKESKSRFFLNYCKLIGNLINQNTLDYFVPNELFSNLQELNPSFRIGEQNDSSICIMNILKYLEKETIKSGEPTPEIIESLEEDDKMKFKNYINKYYSKKNSYILDYFYGFQQDIYECRLCKYKNNNSFQGFIVLNLPIVTSQNNHIINLDTLKVAIDHYQYGRLHKNEEGFDCPKCKNRDIMTKSTIISYPKILIINFKRVGEQYFYNHNLEIPFELNVDKYKYELIGFIKHFGGAKSGHNIAICKNFFDNKWYEYDDHEVKNIKNKYYNKKKDEPNTANGFLFFYKKTGILETTETEDEKNNIIQASLYIRNNNIFNNY